LRKLFALLASLALVAMAVAPAAAATPPKADPPLPAAGSSVDNAAHPLGTKQADMKKTALERVLSGAATPSGVNKRVKLAKGQYVELARTGEDKIWTVLGQFGTQVNPTYGGTAGPLHNQIPQPDRAVDNTNIWTADFNKAYYEKMLFDGTPGAVSMRNFYIEQSSNRYTVNGQVEDWVNVPFNEANYGSDYCGSIVCARTWLFVRDSVNAWYADKVAAGWTAADFTNYLSQFDVWDRYDHDGDGNFNEPDGYIDHFQSLHAGSGEETGGGAQGSDAIWSHRWYAFYNNIGFTGPSPDSLLGGVKIGGTNFWIGDYTVEPEDGGVGVFSHEFGHDLGLPDLYDTSGNVGGAENSTGFWTLYSSGSYGSTGNPADGIGSKPIDMSALEKIQLGWSNYALVDYRQQASIKLGPAEANTKQAQQIVALLPDKNVDFNVGSPHAGTYFWHSGAGNNLDSSMTRSFALPAGSTAFSASVNYDTEKDFDYFYLRVSDDNGAHWTQLPTNLSDAGANGAVSGSSAGSWVNWTATIPSTFGGKTVLVRIEYVTDSGVSNPGLKVDDVSVGSTTDGAETDGTWTLAGGFVRTTGLITRSFFNAYFAENRQYLGYDTGLRTGPYNFGFLNNPNLQNWVEHFPYQDGLLVWYYDESFADNNVGEHCAAGRCGGLFLPVDAHPNLLYRPDNGAPWRPRIQSFDSTFTLDKTDAITLHANSVAQTIPSRAGVSTFDDRMDWWIAPGEQPGANGWSGVNVPATGTTMRITSVSSTGFMQVLVNQ
jgi:immune inhibitor A